MKRLLFRAIPLPFLGRSLPLVYLLYMLLALIAATAELLKNHGINNYLIFEGVYRHVVNEQNLYATYPAEYDDHNHYGPVFALLIAPFALLPQGLGVILWCLANAGILLYAIDKMPLNAAQKTAAAAIGMVEMMTSIHNEQFNPMLTAFFVLSWVGVRQGKDHWATLFIALGFFIKLYGIAGLTFFLFSKHKARFVAWFVFWCGVCFALPMLISSPAYIVQTYADWAARLAQKNADNASISAENFTDISVLGMMRRILGVQNLNIPAVLAVASAAFGLPLLQPKRWAWPGFQLHYLALVLLTVVLFSSGSEGATYVLAMTGFSLWFVYAWQGEKWMIALLIFCLLLTTFSSTDLFPRFVKQAYIRKYSLKALPMLLVWLLLLYRCITGRTENPKPALVP